MPSIGYQFKSSGSRQVIKDYDDIGAAARRSRQEVERAPRTPAQRSGGKSPEVKAAEESVKALRAVEKKKLDVIARAAREAQALRVKSYKAESRALEKEQREQAKASARIAKLQYERSTRGRVGASWNKLKNYDDGGRMAMAGVIGVAGIAGGALAGGIAATGLAYNKRANLLEQAQKLSTAGRMAGTDAVDPRQLMEGATRTAAMVRGTKAEDVLSGQQKYVQMTGDLEGAQTHARTFSIVARATGASEENIAATAATLKDKFKIEDEGEMKRALSNMNFQGKTGAFEMADASRYFAEMGAAGATFGQGIGSGARGVQTLGGLAQIARAGKGSGAEASTATQAMLRQLVAKSDVIQKKTGTKVFADNGKTKTNDIRDTLVGVVSGAKGNQAILQEIFGDEGKGAVNPLIAAYNDGARAVKKDATEKERQAAGAAAMRKMLDDAIDAGGTWTETEKDAAANTDNASAKLTTAWEAASAAIGDKLIGPMDSFAAAVEGIDWTTVGDGIGYLVEALADGTEAIAKVLGLDLNKGSEPPSMTPVADLAANKAEQDAITAGAKRSGRKLTREERSRLRELQAKGDSLQAQIDDPNNRWVEDKPEEFGVRFDKNGKPISSTKAPTKRVDKAQIDAKTGKWSQAMKDAQAYEKVNGGPKPEEEAFLGLFGKGSGSFVGRTIGEAIGLDAIDKIGSAANGGGGGQVDAARSVAQDLASAAKSAETIRDALAKAGVTVKKPGDPGTPGPAD